MFLVIEHDSAQQMQGNRPLEIAKLPVRGDSPMLVKIRQFPELPKLMTSNGNGIPSVVRLKVFDDCCGFRGNPSGLPFENFIVNPVQDGKLNLPTRGFGCQSSKSPNDVIQRGSEATQKVASDKPNIVWNFSDLPDEAMPLPFNVILAEESVGLRVVENGKLIPKRIQMIFRPSCFQIGISEAAVHGTTS